MNPLVLDDPILTLYDRMTREEREEAYNRARERIFGSSDKNGDSQGKSSLRICQMILNANSKSS